MWIKDVFGFECVEIIDRSFGYAQDFALLKLWDSLILGQYRGFLIYFWFSNLDKCLLEVFVTLCYIRVMVFRQDVLGTEVFEIIEKN